MADPRRSSGASGPTPSPVRARPWSRCAPARSTGSISGCATACRDTASRCRWCRAAELAGDVVALGPGVTSTRARHGGGRRRRRLLRRLRRLRRRPRPALRPLRPARRGPRRRLRRARRGAGAQPLPDSDGPLLRRGGGDPARLPDRLAHARRARRARHARGRADPRRRLGRLHGRRSRSRRCSAPAASSRPRAAAEKLERARALGATDPIAPGEDFARAVRAATGGRGVDVVVDHVGGETFERSLRCLAKGGRVVLCGATAARRGQGQSARDLLQGPVGARLDHGLERRAGHAARVVRARRAGAGRRAHACRSRRRARRRSCSPRARCSARWCSRSIRTPTAVPRPRAVPA